MKTCLMVCLSILFSVELAALPPLPEPVANNAVASVGVGESQYFISFMGLGPGKGYRDVHNRVWTLKLGEDQWRQGSPVPSSLTLKGRLASVAVGVGEYAYLFGGYTVAEDHSEVSSPDNFRYQPQLDEYKRIAATPVPTDDAVALAFRDRYIYLVSGWHNDGNVNLVQVYDIETDRWSQASPFLGAPVFGHAGGIVDATMVICDGVRVQPRPDKRRGFAAETACYTGTIDAGNPLKIDWRTIPHPTGKARYRMAAIGLDHSGRGVLFAGGSDNPYNYNGVGYNDVPSEPDAGLWFFDVAQRRWSQHRLDTATMDHRGLLLQPGARQVYIAGGMTAGQRVSQSLFTVPLDWIASTSRED